MAHAVQGGTGPNGGRRGGATKKNRITTGDGVIPLRSRAGKGQCCVLACVCQAGKVWSRNVRKLQQTKEDGKSERQEKKEGVIGVRFRTF